MSNKCPKCTTDNPDTVRFCGECGSQLPSPKDIEVTETLETLKEELTRGTTFAGRYEVIEELGKGGMGRVYRVEDTKLKQEGAHIITVEYVRGEDLKSFIHRSGQLAVGTAVRIAKQVCEDLYFH